jgi:hypothetical protein
MANDSTEKKGSAPMKLTTITNISVAVVMQGLGGSGEERRADLGTAAVLTSESR